MASCLKPSKLYNRSEEQDLLGQAYEHRTFSLITGRPGSGRTSLAQTLKSRVQNDGGYFLRGKFDQFKCRSPYPAFVAAFSDFAEQVEARGQTDEMRQRIRANVAAEGKILTDMIPALKSMVDTQQHTTIQGEKAVARSMFVFLAFLQAVSSPEQPLVVLFDDLQWADPCSLGLLSTCVSMNKNAGVTFVATCVDNVQPDAVLSTTLREMEQNDTLICHIAIKNLPPVVVSELLGDILNLSPQDADSLASYVQARTDGNIYFILELLRYLEQGGFLTQGEEEKWDWTDDNLCTELALKSLLKDSVESLSQPVQKLLKVAALLGGTLDERLLSHALSTPVKSYLLEAEKYRLIVFDRGAYRWAHDEVEALVFSLVEPDQVEKTCLAIGRKMWMSMDEEELRDSIFDVLNQLKRGAKLITSQKERYAIASLCLWAGEKAAKGSTFRTAVVYLDFGFDLLGPNHWREEYDLSLVLFSLTAEINFCLGDISPGASERSEYLCQQVFDHGRVLRDKVRLHVLRVYMLGAKDQMEDAKRHGLDVLKELDVRFPKKANKYHVAVEAFKMRRRLSRKSIETLCRLPTMSDPDKIAAVQILNVLFMSAFQTDPLFAPLIALRMVDLSLNYGLCAVSSAGFAIYGMLVCTLHHDVDVGFRLGQFSLQILEKFQCGEYIPRVYAAVYGFINRWKHKYEDSLGPLRYSHQVGLESGDTEFALVSAAVWSYTAFNCGKPLSYVDSHISAFLEALESRNHEAQNVLMKPFLQMVRILMGKNTRHTTTLSGDIVEEEAIIQQVVKSNNENMLLWIHYHKANLNFLFSDFDTAALEITKARKLTRVPFANVEASLIYFIDGMAHLVSARHRSIPTAKRSLRLLKGIAKKAPQNTLAIMYLLQAELFAQFPRRKESAIMNFMSAIAVASDSQVALDIGMAHERFGNFYDRLGEKQLGRNHYRQALEAYSGWGALAKVNHMREVYPNL